MSLFVVLVAFAFSCGGQWAVLQGIAWANMIREYSEVVPLGEAVKMTFSGQYPCAMCKAIAEKKDSENNKAVALFQHEKKIACDDLRFPGRVATISELTFLVTEESLRTRVEAPPTPPPRSA